VRGSRIAFRFRAKHRVLVHTAVVDSELADAMKQLRAAPGGRTLFRYRHNDKLVGLSARRLNDYIQEHMGEEFTAKDFRTWGGTCSPRSRWPSARGPRRRPSSSARCPRSCARSASSSETPPQLRALRTSALRLSNSISTGEQWMIFDPGIYASSARGIWASISKNKRC
jgi:DNA topoisomerase I